MNPQLSHYINGEWLQGGSEEFDSLNPGNSERIWQGYCAEEQQIDLAIDAAANAFSHWANLPIVERAAYLVRFTELLSESKELLAETIGQETGKPLWEALTEVTAMQGKATITIKAYQERCKSINENNNGIRSTLSHRPHGVIAIFGPYNFPCHLPNGHIMPALLAGNTLIFKPSELTPKSGEFLMNLWHKAGLPNGVLNMLQGGKGTGEVLASHSQINGLYFTGSANTGSYLHQQFGGQPEKILALEMGGNNPLLVTQIKNIPAAVYNTIQSAFITSGQRCTCARRLIVPEGSDGDHFIQELSNAIKQIQVGTYNQQPPPFMGSLISQQAMTLLLSAQEALIQQGAESLISMQRFTDRGALLSPGLIDCTAIETPPDEEFFGPLLQLYRVKDLEQATALANNTRYGLSAGVLSDDPETFKFFQRHVRAGLINWNRPITGASSSLPFGGIGMSGNHRASAWYAADYCAYPVASQQSETMELPESLSPGIQIEGHIWGPS